MITIHVAIEGMKCPMCEAHANDALRKAFPTLKKVTSSHKENKAVILTETDFADDAIRAALAPTGYTVGAITREKAKKKGLFGLFS